MKRRLRFVVFSASIVSDIGNPEATTVRAMCQALMALGHDVVHGEVRQNRHLVDLLTLRGSEPVRAFNRAMPLLTYRQFDLLPRSPRRIWFSREISTADAVVGFPGSDDAVLEEIEELESARTLSFAPGLEDVPASIRSAWFDPGVLPRPHGERREGLLAVGYDHEVPAPDSYRPVSAGALDEPGWTPVTEFDLCTAYENAERVRFCESDVLGAGYARALLPVAAGATSEIVSASGALIETIDHLDDRHNARVRADTISRFVIQELDRRLGRTT